MNSINKRVEKLERLKQMCSQKFFIVDAADVSNAEEEVTKIRSFYPEAKILILTDEQEITSDT